MEKDKAIEVLNSLIVINNDRIEGYETASKETEEVDLKALFTQFIATSIKCKQELVMQVGTLGGEVAEGTKVTGKIYRIWMDFKAAVTGKDRKTILNSCVFGEEEALDTYEKAIENNTEHLGAEQNSLIHNQKNLLKADCDRVKSLRDALASA